MPSSRVLVTGASGFIGSHLCEALAEAGHSVRAMTRHPETYTGVGEPVRGDVGDPDSLRAALEGVEAAYYLVHSLDSSDFEDKDARGRPGLRRRGGAGRGRADHLPRRPR